MTEALKTEPASLPSLIKSELVPQAVTQDETLAPLLRALTSLDPAAKTALIQSLLAAVEGEPEAWSPQNSPPSLHQNSPPSLHQTSPPSLHQNSPPPPTSVVTTRGLPTLVPSTTSVPMSLAAVHIVPVSIVPSTPSRVVSSPFHALPSSTFNFSSSRVTPHALPSSPFNFSSSRVTPHALPSSSFNFSSSPLPHLTTVTASLPQLVPVTEQRSEVTATSSVSVMNSGVPTAFGVSQRNRNTEYPVLLSNGNAEFPKSLSSTMEMYNTSTANVSEVMGTCLDRSSTGLLGDSDRSSTENLHDQLTEVRSKLLLSTLEQAGNAPQWESLVKIEHLLNALQGPPSMVFGGRQRGQEEECRAEQGVKRKASPKMANTKSGKKVKHSGGSHGIQLWQFILELLGDTEHRTVVSWTGNGLEFRIINSVELARLWGIRKRNPIMNFDKLSRALRYYYEKNIIKHNPMHRLVYSFCNNPNDMVYNALLNRALSTCPINRNTLATCPGERTTSAACQIDRKTTTQNCKDPYEWMEKVTKSSSPIKVKLQSIGTRQLAGSQEGNLVSPVNNC